MGFFRSDSPPEDPEALVGMPPASPSSELKKEVKKNWTGPSDHLTPHQIFYLFVIHGVGAMILSGGINFAIAYGMYSPSDADDGQPIRLWNFPRTLAGDVGVTTIVQPLITYTIESLMVRRDLRISVVQPIGFVTRPTSAYFRKLFMLDEFQHNANPGRPGHWLSFFLAQAHVILAMSLICFVVSWGPAVGMLYALGDHPYGPGGDPYYPRTWLPQGFKGVFGAILSLFATPWMCAFWVVRAGWIQSAADGSRSQGLRVTATREDGNRIEGVRGDSTPEDGSRKSETER